MHQPPELTKVTVDASLKAESLLLEELRQRSDNASQINSEVSSTFNLYLIVAGIIATGVASLQSLYFQLFNQGYVPTFADVITVAVLLLGGVLSFIFLLRFLQLAEREFHNIAAITKIRAFYMKYLKTQMPTIEEAFYQHNEMAYFSNVPVYIRYTVSLVGSLSFGGAAFNLLSYAVSNVPNHPLIIDSFFSVIVFFVSFFLLQWYYHRYMAKFLKGTYIK